MDNFKYFTPIIRQKNAGKAQEQNQKATDKKQKHLPKANTAYKKYRKL
jgi:hypothetical protein